MENNKGLSPKEEEIMTCFWEHGDLFIREVVELLPDPKPHFNTVSTFVRGLEAKGWLTRELFGNSFRYSAAVPLKEYQKTSLSKMVNRLFGKSYLNFVSTLVKEEKVSTDELRKLIEKVESSKTL